MYVYMHVCASARGRVPICECACACAYVCVCVCLCACACVRMSIVITTVSKLSVQFATDKINANIESVNIEIDNTYEYIRYYIINIMGALLHTYCV